MEVEGERRYFTKEVINEFGQPQIIKVDKIELTDYYQQIIREVEIKVAREFTKNPSAEFPTIWDGGWQLPSLRLGVRSMLLLLFY